MAVVAANDVWAVGDITVSGGATQTLVEQWNGTKWRVVKSPNPGPSLNILNGVAADPGSGQTWAVGVFFDNTTSQGQALIEFNP